MDENGFRMQDAVLTNEDLGGDSEPNKMEAVIHTAYQPKPCIIMGKSLKITIHLYYVLFDSPYMVM